MGKRKYKTSLQNDCKKPKHKGEEPHHIFGWAKFSRNPWWPVKVISDEGDSLKVFIKSDNAIMIVKKKDLVNFETPKKREGIAYLEKKKRLLDLDAFLKDVAWAEEELKGERANKDTKEVTGHKSSCGKDKDKDKITENKADDKDNGNNQTPDKLDDESFVKENQMVHNENDDIIGKDDYDAETPAKLDNDSNGFVIENENDDVNENANGDRGTGDGSDYLQSKNMIIEREDDNSFDQDNCDAEPQAKQDDNSKQMIENEEDDTNDKDSVERESGEKVEKECLVVKNQMFKNEDDDIVSDTSGDDDDTNQYPALNLLGCTFSKPAAQNTSPVIPVEDLQVVQESDIEDVVDSVETPNIGYVNNNEKINIDKDSSDDQIYVDSDDLFKDPDYKYEQDNETSDDYEEGIAFQEFVSQITVGDKVIVEKQPSTSAVKCTYETNSTDKVDKVGLVSKSEIPCQRSVPEKDKLRDEKYPGIYIKRYNSSNEGKKGIKKDDRPYDTVHACKFCSGLFTHIQDHVENKHKKEPQVLKIAELKEKVKNLHDHNQQKLIKQYQCLLRYEGDHLHNIKVLRNKDGELLVQRKACGKETFVHHNYGPCPKCFVWLHLEHSLQAHRKNCNGLEDTGIIVFGQEKKGLNMAVSKAIIGEGLEIDKSCPLVGKYVMPIIRNDDVGKLAKEDRLIIELGEIWMVKSYGNKLARNKTSSFRMRLCARLLAAVRGFTKVPNLSVRDILCPEYFDDIVKVTLNLCEKDDQEKLKHPSIALKIGYDLGRLAGLKLCTCIKEQDKEGESSTKQFLKLLKLQWSAKVSKFAHLSVSEKHFDNHRELPHPKDIATIAERLVGLAKELKLSEAGQYHEVVQVALPRLMVYNRRRSGEIEALHIERYQKRTIQVDDVEESLLGDLTTLERYLLETQELMWIRGKQGKRVPVLIPPDMKEPLAYIADGKMRAAAGVKQGNPYLFANKGHGVYSALQCLRVCCSDDNLIHPDRLTSTGFRAYMATIAQCIGLKDHEVQWMCDHLGHTIDVHQSHYRHTMEGIERIQLGKLLMIQDRNMVNEYRVKGLQGIQFTDIIETFDEGTNQGPEPLEDQYIFNKEHVDGEENTKKNKESVRQKWTADEVDELKRLFHLNIEKLKCPNTKDIIKAKKISENENGFIHLRKLENIKKKMSNMIIKIKHTK